MHPEPARERRGFALVAALALLALSAALLVGAVAIAAALARSVRSERASLVVDAGARYAMGSVIAAWSGEVDALVVGQGMERELSPLETGVTGSLPTVGRVRIQRLAPRLYAVVVDVRVGTPALARQRLRLLVTRAPRVDTAGAAPDSVASRDTVPPAGAPRPIARWSAADLY